MPILILAGLILALMAPDCIADGDCPSRPATEQERMAYASMRAALANAVPKAPPDWLMRDQSDTKGGEFMPDCPGGAKESPHHYSFKYQYKYDSAVRDQAAAAAVTDAVKGSPEQQAMMAALDKKYDDLKVQRNHARKSRDPAAADKIRDEMKTVAAERNKLEEEITQAFVSKVQTGQMAKEMSVGIPERGEAQLTFFVNADRAWVPQTAVTVNVTGAQHSYWRSDEGSLVVLLGNWNPTSPTFRANLAKTSVITKPQTVSIEIRAGREMAEQLAREIKLEVIRAQLN